MPKTWRTAWFYAQLYDVIAPLVNVIHSKKVLFSKNVDSESQACGTRE